MTSMNTLCLVIGQAAFSSFGGLVAVLSELQLRLCDEEKLFSSEDFLQKYGLSLASPGPNSMFLALLGYSLGGWPGALLAGMAWAVPTLLWLLVLGRLGSSQLGWIQPLRKGLAPVVFSLLLASGYRTARVFGERPLQLLLCFVALAYLLWRPKTNPMWILLACGLAGFLLGL